MQWVESVFDAELIKELIKFENDIKIGKKEIKTRKILGKMEDDAKDVIIEESLNFLINNGDILTNATKEQQKYIITMAYLSSIKDLDELTVEELLEYRKLSTKAAELGIEVSKQLHAFWKEFNTTVNLILYKLIDIGVRGGATALKLAILNLL